MLNIFEDKTIKVLNLSIEDMSKNFGLNLGEFDSLVQELKRGSNLLFERIFLSHFGDCIGFIQRKYNAPYDDAYDATMETCIEFRLRLIDDKIRYGNLRYLFTKMATQKYLRNLKVYQSREIDEDDLREEKNMYDQEDIEKLFLAWSKLGKECQSVLKLNYYSNMKLSEIALLIDKSAAAVRKQKERCISQLLGIFSKQ